MGVEPRAPSPPSASGMRVRRSPLWSSRTASAATPSPTRTQSPTQRPRPASPSSAAQKLHGNTSTASVSSSSSLTLRHPLPTCSSISRLADVLPSPRRSRPKALKKYAAQLAKYPFLDNGLDLPCPLPEDLELPFGEFVEKHGLGPMVLLASKLSQGFGNLLDQPTLYVVNFGATALQGLAKGFLVTDGVDNTELYRRAEAELADSLLLSSTVIFSSRSEDCPVQVRVRTSSGQEMLIKADKLLVTIPPTRANLANLDLDDTEEALFSQFQHSSWWTLLICNSAIPDNHCITNLNSVYSSGGLPGIYEITPTRVPNTLNLKYGSPHHLPAERVEQDVLGVP